jgi:hypothetical protein
MDPAMQWLIVGSSHTLSLDELVEQPLSRPRIETRTNFFFSKFKTIRSRREITEGKLVSNGVSK